jgi:hypothetical protein
LEAEVAGIPYSRTLAAALLGLALCCALTAANAQARVISVSGTETVVDEQAGTYRMHGDLVGGWKITSFKEIATSPLYQGTGTERFRGCLDRGHDGRCAGDPKGTLRLRFRYWALFGPGDALRAGACSHPIVDGTGAFNNARGLIQMLDAPTASGVETTYVGRIRIGGGAAASASRMSCG